MFKQQIISQLANQLGNIVKTNPLADIEENCKALLKSAFEKMDLVTREEFDIQQKVLMHTRQKLEELERVVKQLEQQAGLK